MHVAEKKDRAFASHMINAQTRLSSSRWSQKKPPPSIEARKKLEPCVRAVVSSLTVENMTWTSLAASYAGKENAKPAIRLKLSDGQRGAACNARDTCANSINIIATVHVVNAMTLS